MPAAETAPVHAAIVRFAIYLGFWIVVAAPDGFADILVGCIAAAVATGLSLRLMPPAGAAPSPAGIAGLARRIVTGSIRAGIDVAGRALGREVRLRPGFVAYRTGLPDGNARSLYLTVASLLPGTLPAAVDADGTVQVHCLDTALPVAADMARDEAALCRAIGREAAHG